ncbi:MAG: hypothetical protein QOE34_175 [Verrucomicrobiota bacterium]|jgi:hypothetical protein
MVAAIAAQAAVDFTPGTGQTVLDGLKFPFLIFHENGKQISYEQPAGWKYSGDSSHIRFTPPNLAQAQADIDQSSLPAPQDFNDETMKALQQKTLSSIPPGSAKAAIVTEEKNPILVNGHETYEVTVGYEAFGREFQTSVLYLNLPDTQLRFRATALKADFEKVHRAFRGSVFSWQWHEPQPEKAQVTVAKAPVSTN